MWDSERGRLHCLCVGHQGSVLSASFAWDKPWLASGGDDGTVKIWDVTTGELVANCKGHTAPVQSVTFAPDGQTVASGSRDNTIRLWDVPTGNPVATYNHTAPAQSVAFAPDGHWLASGGADATAQVWDVTTGQRVATLVGHTAPVRGVAWAAAEATPRAAWHSLRAGTPASHAVALDHLAVVSEGQDGTVHLWETRTGRCLHTLSVEEILDTEPQGVPERRAIQEDEHFDAHLSLFPLEGHNSWVQGIKVALVGRSTHGGGVYREGRTGLEGGVSFADLEPGEYRILLADDVFAATRLAVDDVLSQGTRMAVAEDVEVTNALLTLRLKHATEGSIELAIHPHAPLVPDTSFPVTIEDPETGDIYTGNIVGDGKFHILEVWEEERKLRVAAAKFAPAQTPSPPGSKEYPLSDPRVIALLQAGVGGRAVLTVFTKVEAFAGARVRFILGRTTGEMTLHPTDPPGEWSERRILDQDFRTVVDLHPRFSLEEGTHDDV